MSHFHRYKDCHVDLGNIGGEFQGWFILETFKGVEFPKGSGRVFEFAGTRRKRAEFPNIITNQGFNFLSTHGSINGEVAVGTGNTPESATDTTLVNFVAGQSTTTSSTFTAQGTAPYYGSQTKTWRFGEGAAAGILAEAGIGRGNCNVDGSDLWSRALIKNELGVPTTIEVDVDEWLDVTYQLRLYPKHLVDDTGSVLIQGVSYNYTMRNALVTSGAGWGAYLSSKFPTNSGVGTIGKVYEAGSTLGDVTSTPSGANDDFYQRTEGTYSADSYNQDCVWNLRLGDGNWAGGFDAMLFVVNCSIIQVSLDAAVPKDEFKVFDFTVNFNWGFRSVIP